jgi:hypothetical protein
VSVETSLKLVLGDGVDVHMGIAVRLPPVGCRAIELVRSKEDLLTISALGDHEFLFTPLSQTSASMGSLACEKVVRRVRRNSASLMRPECEYRKPMSFLYKLYYTK